MALRPEATNRVTCTSCGWTRILDPTRAYRGGHTHPTEGYECHEMLRYEQVSPLPPEVVLLEEDPKATAQELTMLEPEDYAVQLERNAAIDERLAKVYSDPELAHTLSP